MNDTQPTTQPGLQAALLRLQTHLLATQGEKQMAAARYGYGSDEYREANAAHGALCDYLCDLLSMIGGG